MAAIDLHLFHFIRPQFLWLFAIMFLIVAGYIWKAKQSSKWIKIIAEPLRKYVIDNPSQKKQILPILFFTIAASLLILGLAGPTFSKKKMPTVINESEVWFALDVSQSMMTDDISPSRLERAKFKIRDVLDEKTATKTGLIVYSGTPHIVFPPSIDNEVFISYMDVIGPEIMPVQGENYRLLLKMADTIFKKLTVPGTFIILTDNIDEQMAKSLKRFRDSTENFVKVWLISTEKGGTVPGFNKNTSMHYKGQTVTSKLTKESMDLLKNEDRIEIIPITLDNSDVEHITKFIKDHKKVKKQLKGEDKNWDDKGLYLLWIVLPFMLLWFRRGWVLKGFGIISVLFILPSCDSQEFKNAFETPNYQAQRLDDKGEHKQAANLYSLIPNKAYSYMKAGDYEAAANLYAMDSTANSQYNAGLLFQQIGDTVNAGLAFNKAISLNPGFDKASVALDSLNVQIKRVQEQLAQRNKDKDKGDWKDDKKKKKKDDSDKYGERERVDRVYDPKAKDNKSTRVETHYVAKTFKKKQKKFDPSTKIDINNGDPISVLIMSSKSNPQDFLKKKFAKQKKNYYSKIKETDKLW